MLINSGIDIVEVKRMKDAVKRWGSRFTGRVFTQRELDYACRNRFPFEHLAARFAAKEAVAKAIGNGLITRWNEIEIAKSKSGSPSVVLHGRTRSLFLLRKIEEIQVSISHTRTFAVANAIVIKKGSNNDKKRNY